MKYHIAKSPIHGVGVFASCAVANGAIIGTLETVLVGNIKDYSDLPTVGVITKIGNIYVPISGFPLWAINYSSSPNVEADQYGVFATRDIHAGEELLINSYAEQARNL